MKNRIKSVFDKELTRGVAKLAVLILTLNEEKRIARCISSALFSDEVIVIDSGSTDNTVNIATELGAKVVFRPMVDGFGAQRNFALTQTEAEWVMFLDADELITPELAEEIKMVVSQDKPGAFEMLRHNHVLGKYLGYGVFKPDWSLRLYPRTAINWSGIIHETAQATCSKSRLKGTLLHYPYDNWEQYFAKFNSYTAMMANKMYESGKKANIFSVTIRPIWAFFRVYILQSGWRDGWLGLIISILHGFYTLVKYIKLDYLWQKNSEK